MDKFNKACAFWREREKLITEEEDRLCMNLYLF